MEITKTNGEHCALGAGVVMFLILAVITARFFIFTENPGWFEWSDFLIMAAAMVLIGAMVIRLDVKACPLLPDVHSYRYIHCNLQNR